MSASLPITKLLKDLPKPDDSKDTTGHDDKVTEVVTEGHASENRKWSVKLNIRY
jgi:hypothetical protein